MTRKKRFFFGKNIKTVHCEASDVVPKSESPVHFFKTLFARPKRGRHTKGFVYFVRMSVCLSVKFIGQNIWVQKDRSKQTGPSRRIQKDRSKQTGPRTEKGPNLSNCSNMVQNQPKKHPNRSVTTRTPGLVLNPSPI